MLCEIIMLQRNEKKCCYENDDDVNVIFNVAIFIEGYTILMFYAALPVISLIVNITTRKNYFVNRLQIDFHKWLFFKPVSRDCGAKKNKRRVALPRRKITP